VQGVGAANRDQIEKAYFRALTVLMPSSATFALTRIIRIMTSFAPGGAAPVRPSVVVPNSTALPSGPNNPWDAISLGLALMLGLLGLPHILMGFYTVPDARAARSSVLYATGFVGYFYLIIPLVGFGASALLGATHQGRPAAAWRRRSWPSCSAHGVSRLHRGRRVYHVLAVVAISAAGASTP
jgi:Na+(H+)/acetate symporter ActP